MNSTNPATPDIDFASRLSAGTCDLCESRPVAVVRVRRGQACESCLREGIAAIEAKKEPMTEQRSQICKKCGGRVNLSGVCVYCDEEQSSQKPTPSDVLREALALAKSALDGTSDEIYADARRVLVNAAMQHLPALLTELTQLRELAKAAVENDQLRQRALATAEIETRAYVASQPKAAQ